MPSKAAVWTKEVTQFFKQTGLHWALSNKTKLKEKVFVLSYVESQRHFILVLSELCLGR